MEIQISRESNIPVMHVAGRIDAATAPEFERQCQAALAGGEQYLVLDFAGVRYVSSAGLRALLAIGKALTGRGGALCLAALAGIVREVFEISGFGSLFPQHPTAEDAVKHCQYQIQGKNGVFDPKSS